MGDPGLASKFIESQIEDAERGAGELKRSGPGLSPAAIERQESLRQSIARTRRLLEAAKTTTQRKMFKRALKTLEAEAQS